MIIFLHACRSLARGLPLFLGPPHIPNIIDISKLFPLRMICPNYDSCCFFINASSGFVGLIYSLTDVIVLLAVHSIRSSLLQHQNSKRSIRLLFAFLIVQDSQPYSTTGKLMRLLFGTLLQLLYICLSISCLALSLPLCLIPIVSQCLLTRTGVFNFGTEEDKIPYYFHFLPI